MSKKLYLLQIVTLQHAPVSEDHTSMKEIKAIIEAYDAIEPGTMAALATVVRVQGSSYRRTGARMLILDNGNWIGGISGGCLEGDALKRARLAIKKSASTLITYDTTEEDAYQIGVGLGCNGIIDVLFTPLNLDNTNNPVEILKACISAHRQTHVLITITRLEGNWAGIATGEVINFHNNVSLDILQSDQLMAQLTSWINEQLIEGKSMPRQFVLEDGRTIEIFIEILSPEINLVIIGHQYDMYPFSRLMKELGWRVTIVANPNKINKKITDIADQVISPEALNQLTADGHTAMVLMSHDYNTDKYNLPKALSTGAPYIGILGPRVRSEKILNELRQEGFSITTEDLERIFAPVGLDIGAVTPEEIALSLAAEVKATISKRNGSFLRLRSSSIHERG